MRQSSATNIQSKRPSKRSPKHRWKKDAPKVQISAPFPTGASKIAVPPVSIQARAMAALLVRARCGERTRARVNDRPLRLLKMRACAWCRMSVHGVIPEGSEPICGASQSARPSGVAHRSSHASTAVAVICASPPVGGCARAVIISAKR